jgi:hypothetical protein
VDLELGFELDVERIIARVEAGPKAPTPALLSPTVGRVYRHRSGLAAVQVIRWLIQYDKGASGTRSLR